MRDPRPMLPAPRARLALLLAAICSAARAEEPAGAADWFVGSWTYSTADGRGRFVFEAGGTFSLEIEATGEGRAVLSGTWRLSGGSVELRLEGETMTLNLERLPDEGGRMRARFLMEGTEATAIAWTRDAPLAEEGNPAWLAGTWTTTGRLRERRYVLLPEGDGLIVYPGGEPTPGVAIRWSVKEGRLLLETSESPLRRLPPLDIVRESDADGLPRARFVNSTNGQIRDMAPIFARRPFPPAGTPCDEPFLGRWRGRDGASPVSLTLLPDGRFERRRACDAGAPLEPGTFTTSHGAAGDRLRLVTAALAEEDWLVRLDPSGSLHLRPQEGGAEIAFDRVAGADEVRRRAAAADARYGHDVLSWQERLTPVRLSARPGDGGKRESGLADPNPDRVEPDALVLPRPATWVQVDEGAEAGGAGPRRQAFRWTFERDGRFSVVAPDAMEGGPPPRFGCYSLSGATLTANFDDGREEQLRLLDGGRYLLFGKTLLEIRDVVSGTTVDSPR